MGVAINPPPALWLASAIHGALDSIASASSRTRVGWSRDPALRNEGCAGIGDKLSDTTHARNILCQVEIVRTGCSGRFSNDHRQVEGGGVEHGKLPIQQMD